MPLGYRSVVSFTGGGKDRKKLQVVEHEAAVVRLIFDLALRGVDGQPMGTRSIAAYLNDQGYSFRGKPFQHSGVDGVLRREHYSGYYYDRTCPLVDTSARPEDAIRVPCPKIIEPEIAAAVAARRAKAAPTVTPPRVTNSATLLTGICRCGQPRCEAGLTIRTGKGGRYAYYTCNRRAGAARACDAKPIPADALDKIVIDGLLQRVLRPSRLRALLTDVLDLSEAADEKRREDWDRIRRQRVEAEKKMRNLLVALAEGQMSAKDRIFSELLAEYKASIATLSEREQSLARALATGTNRISEESLSRFADAIRAKLAENTAMRKAYVCLLVDRVIVDNDVIKIAGSNAALEAAVGAHAANKGMVPRFDREWCRLQDSNL